MRTSRYRILVSAASERRDGGWEISESVSDSLVESDGSRGGVLGRDEKSGIGGRVWMMGRGRVMGRMRRVRGGWQVMKGVFGFWRVQIVLCRRLVMREVHLLLRDLSFESWKSDITLGNVY